MCVYMCMCDVSMHVCMYVSVCELIYLGRPILFSEIGFCVASCSYIYIPYGRKFWRGIYFGGLAVLRAIRQYFIRQKLHSVMSHYG